MQRSFWSLAGWLLLSFAVSAIGGYLTSSEIGTWYSTLQKPDFQPPNWLFAPVWLVLYTLMAVAAWRVHQRVGTLQHVAIHFYLVQLFLNFLWTILFFWLHLIGVALGEILLLWVSILLTTFFFARIDRFSAWLFVPYAFWVGFASYLNFAIWRLNA